MDTSTSKKRKGNATASAPRKRSTKITEASEPGPSPPGALEVVGRYNITSPAMEAKWNGDQDEEEEEDEDAPSKKSYINFKMSFYRRKIKTKYQMFATFDFSGIRGLIRFESIVPSPSSIWR